MEKKIAISVACLLLASMFVVVFSTSASAIKASEIILWNKLETGLISEYGPNGWTKFGSPAELHEAAVFNDGSQTEGIQRVGFTLWGNQIAGETPKWGQDEITIEFWVKPDIEALSNAYGNRVMITFRKGSENPQGYVRIIQVKEYITIDGICEDFYSGYKMSDDFTHLAISVSTSTLNFYINNELKFTSNLRSEVLGTYMPYELLLGGGWMYNDWDWYGIIDNIKVFNFAKTDFSDRFVEGIPLDDNPIDDIQDLIETIIEMDLHHGIENSLTKKLSNVIGYLEIGDFDDAASLLNAFVNQVEAQRGKKLTYEQADIIIAAIPEL